MAQLHLPEKPAAADMAALYWWRRDHAAGADSEEAAPLTERIAALAERAIPATPTLVDLPGNRLRANAEARRARMALALKEEIAHDPHHIAAPRRERRDALVARATGIAATAAAMAAAVYAAMLQEPAALCFALAGTFAASFALYHAARGFLLVRSDARPNIPARRIRHRDTKRTAQRL